MSEMVERVAKAVVNYILGGPADNHEQEQELLNGVNVEDMVELNPRELARAAIEAMRDPTAKMVRAACKAMSPSEREGLPTVSNKEKHRIRYRAMIDAALGENQS